MKKLLLSVLTLMTVSVFAQNISIRLSSPVSGTQIRHNQAVDYKFYIKNNSGPDTTLLATDTTVYVRFSSFTVVGGTVTGITPLGPFSRVEFADSIAAGDSAEFTRNISLSIDTNLNNVQAVLGFTLYRIDDTDTLRLQGYSARIYTLINNTSVTEIAKAASSVKLYPNPAVDVLNIELDYNKTATVRILDITGKVIGTQTMENGSTQVDVSSLAKGIYIYELSSENQVIKTGKFSVTR